MLPGLTESRAVWAQHGSTETLLSRKEQQPHLFPLSLVLKVRARDAQATLSCVLH
jgi:hypothetical protein